MSVFEANIQTLEQLLHSASPAPINTQRFVAAPKNAHAGLVLKSDMCAEFGAPQAMSARISLYGNAVSERRDNAWLIGRPFVACRGQSVDFAHVVILRGEKIDAETFYQFNQRYQRLLDQPGVMVKAMADKVWLRCADTDAQPINFERIAATFNARVHEAFPAITSVSSWYVSAETGLVAKLARHAQEIVQTIDALRNDVWKSRGFDYRSCQLTGHCGSCSDKKLCQSIRKIEAQVRLNRRNRDEEGSES